MQRKKIFISSVQSEFKNERQILFDYLTSDAEDIDEKKVINFVARARVKRNFPFDESTHYKTILSHLDLIADERVTNAAILLFGKNRKNL